MVEATGKVDKLLSLRRWCSWQICCAQDSSAWSMRRSATPFRQIRDFLHRAGGFRADRPLYRGALLKDVGSETGLPQR